MTKKEAQRIKQSILRCLTEDFPYGKTKTGRPLKRSKFNQAIFDPAGYAVFNGTDLEMVMNRVVLGIWFCLEGKDHEKAV